MFLIQLSHSVDAIFYTLLWLIMDISTAFLMYYAFLPPKERKLNPLFFLLTVAAAVACNAITDSSNAFSPLWDIPSPMETALTYAVVLIGIRLMFDSRWHRYLLIFIALYALSVQIQYDLLERISIRNGCSLLSFYWAYDVYYITITASKIITFFWVWILFGLRKFRAGKHTVISWLLLAIPLPTVVLVLFLNYFSTVLFTIKYNISGSWLLEAQLIMAAICTVFIIASNTSALYLIHISEYSAKKTNDMRLLRQQMDIQLQSYLSLEKSYRKQRAASHEFSHHLTTIQALLSDQDSEPLRRYVAQLQERQNERVFAIHSHHPVIDAVLNQKYQTAKENGIDMQVKINDLSNISLPLDHLVVLLANLLDNAIESCSLEKQIRLSFVADHTIFLSIDNTSVPTTVRKGRIFTSKSDSRQHGYGLENVKLILDELHAEYTFRYQDGWFRFAAEIPPTRTPPQQPQSEQ